MDVDAPALAIVLIVFQIGDAIACIGPIPPIEASLDRIECPPRVRRLLPFVKLESAIGLTIGLWVPILGALTIVALVGYFLVAIWSHLRVRDTIANTVPAITVMAFVILVGAVSYFPAA